MITLRRSFYRFIAPRVPDYSEAEPQDVVATTFDRADLVGSKCWNGTLPTNRHLPVIDLDIPCTLVGSRTPGHHHLLIQKDVSWSAYVEILNAMADAGLVERGYVHATVRRGQGFVRLRPGVDEREYRGQPYLVGRWRRLLNRLRGRHPEDMPF